MDRTKILEVLHECHALARVDAPTREALVSACTVQPVAADEELIEWGPPPREFFMVADGEVVLTRAVRGGAAPSNRVLRRGALFGGAAVAGLPARLMSARTLCPSTVLRLPGEALHPLVAASRSLAEAIHDLATLRDHEREIVAALKRSSLAGAVNMRRLRDRLDEAVVERFPAGATIVTQGAPAFGAFYLLRGALEAVRHEGGAAVVVDTVHAGEILCDLALSRHVPEPLELRARDAVEVVRIPSLQRSRGRASVSAAAPRASAVDLRAVVGPAGVAPGPFGELLVEQLREAYRDAASLVRVRFDGAAKAAAPDDAPVLEVSLPADGRAGEAFGEFLARHATTTALAVLDTTGLTDAQVAAIAPCVREVVHLQRGPDDDVRFAPLRALHRVRVGLVGAAGDKPWAPGTLRLRLPPRHASAREDARYAAAVARVGRAITGRRGIAITAAGRKASTR